MTVLNIQNLCNSIILPVCILQRGVLQIANLQMARLTGYTVDELVLNPPDLFIHPEDISSVNQKMKLFQRFDSHPEECSLRVVKKNGRSVSVRGHFTGIEYAGDLAVLVQLTGKQSGSDRMEEQLEYLSCHDPLTGLLNRTSFEDLMDRLKKREYSSMGVIVCDVDGLKLVNDAFGTDMGDSLLVAAAGILKDSFRDNDLIARIGGDEFAILVDGNKLSVDNAGQRIRDKVARYNITNPEFPLSLSIGFSSGGNSTRCPDDVFRHAENNMYREKLYHSNSVRSRIVQTLKQMLEARDYITDGHSGRIEKIVVRMARLLGMTDGKITDLRLLAHFHDIGKVGIPDSILFKPGILTEEEFIEMKRHCEIGHRIARGVPDLEHIADWILKHHEWWDGGGYPMRLANEDIPLECRMLAIADAYDAMTNDRPYRRATSHDAAVRELVENSGTQFDRDLVNLFLSSMDN